MPYGIVPSGWAGKPLDQIIKDMQTKQLAAISASLDVSPTGLIGILNGIMGQAVYEGWQLDGALYAGMDRDTATDDQLVGLGLLTDTPRDPATKTQVTATVNVNAGFNQAPGTMFANITGDPTAIFTNKETVHNTGGGPANFFIAFEAVNPGPQQCLAGTLTEINQPLAGWNSVTNAADGTQGSPIETDGPYRVRQVQEIQAPGSATGEAIRADLLTTLQPPFISSPTINCTVLWNDTDYPDANNVPAHAIEVIAYQPGNTADDDQALVDFILANKDAGTGTHGTSSKAATDSQEITEIIFYTRPGALNIWIALTVKTDPTKFPTNGITLIQELLQTYSQAAWNPGNTVYAEATRGQVVPQPGFPGTGVPGVLNVPVFTIDTVHPPVASADIAVPIRQFAKLILVDVTVI